eukprot:CAMPEP_0116857268 /NCGR_PEP_ID=MMETSP0418-20121206/20445_1 /TAXON_ID=1158023 /ORGANISM="Astrosyne radiata, Strain 13vi08-1A" /LENGTH=72 /DNA_ID=CAMNT_0004490905 /DNA_START=73 /DNA_END=291 /DNA_ORIENTATION=-
MAEYVALTDSKEGGPSLSSERRAKAGPMENAGGYPATVSTSNVFPVASGSESTSTRTVARSSRVIRPAATSP